MFGDHSSLVGVAVSVTIGAFVSLTVTVTIAVPVFPAASVAEHVLMVEPTGNVDPDAGTHAAVPLPDTASNQVAVKDTAAPSNDVASANTALGAATVGAVVSRTVTKKLAALVLPAPSVPEHVTVVPPSGNVDPDAGAQVAAPPVDTLSVQLAAKLTTEPDADVASAITAAGTVTMGAVVSSTFTVKVAVPVLPAVSDDWHETLVVPIGNVAPDAGEQVEVNSAPPTRSVAVTSKLTTAPAALDASTTRFAGVVTTGSVVSTTFTLKVAVPVKPVSSVAEQLTVVEPSANVEPDSGAHATARLTPVASTAVASW